MIERSTAHRVTACVFAFAAAIATAPATRAADAPPAAKESALSAAGNRSIASSDFATLLSGYLLKDGQPNVANASFFFEQCYGGGFVDTLANTFGNTGLAWIAGSASAADERSFGQTSIESARYFHGPGNPFLNPPLTEDELRQISSRDPMDFWTRALATELGQDQTVRDAIMRAGSFDPAGAVARTLEPLFLKMGRAGNTVETGQLASGGGGDAIRLDVPAAKSHHAILWEGANDRPRYSNDLDAVKRALVGAWGDPAQHPEVTIVKVSTLAGLRQALQAIAFGPDAQFVFYASDHGTVKTTVRDVPVAVRPGGAALDNLPLESRELDTMRDTVDNQPLLHIDYTGMIDGPGEVQVRLGGELVGTLPAGSTAGSIDLAIDENLLGLANTLSILNGTDASFVVEEISFTIGAIPTWPDLVVPEPGAGALLVATLLAASAALRRRSSASAAPPAASEPL